MAQRQPRGAPAVQMPDLGTVLMYAAAGAAVIALGDIVIDLLTTIINNSEVEFIDRLKYEAADLLWWGGVLAGVYLVFVTDVMQEWVLKGAAIAYAGSFLHDLIMVIAFEWAELELEDLVYNLGEPMIVVGFAVMLYFIQNQR